MSTKFEQVVHLSGKKAFSFHDFCRGHIKSNHESTHFGRNAVAKTLENYTAERILKWANTPAYFSTVWVTKKKSFTRLAPDS
jgi:hypothetical protein